MQPHKPVKLEDLSDIPEFAALQSDQMRAFVLELSQNGNNAKAAAITAGYSGSYGPVLRSRQDVTEAQFAIAKRLFHGGVFVAFQVAMRILEDPTQTAGDQLKAAAFISDRGGLSAVAQVNIKVEKVINNDEWVLRAMEAAERLGVDPKTLIGINTPVPLIAVDNDPDDPLAGVDDL